MAKPSADYFQELARRNAAKDSGLDKNKGAKQYGSRASDVKRPKAPHKSLLGKGADLSAGLLVKLFKDVNFEMPGTQKEQATALYNNWQNTEQAVANAATNDEKWQLLDQADSAIQKIMTEKGQEMSQRAYITWQTVIQIKARINYLKNQVTATGYVPPAKDVSAGSDYRTGGKNTTGTGPYIPPADGGNGNVPNSNVPNSNVPNSNEATNMATNDSAAMDQMQGHASNDRGEALATSNSNQSLEQGKSLMEQSPEHQQYKDAEDARKNTYQNITENNIKVGGSDTSTNPYDAMEGVNANLMNDRDTLRLSRLADAVNNRQYKPLYNGGIAYAGNGYNSGVSVADKMKPDIQTAETRQQGRTEQYEMIQRQADLARKKLWKDYQFQLQKAHDEYQRELARTHDQQAAQLNYEARIKNIEQQFSQADKAYAMNLADYWMQRRASTMLQMMRENPQWARAYGLQSGAVDDNVLNALLAGGLNIGYDKFWPMFKDWEQGMLNNLGGNQ